MTINNSILMKILVTIKFALLYQNLCLRSVNLSTEKTSQSLDPLIKGARFDWRR
jgi:hypothetical protein